MVGPVLIGCPAWLVRDIGYVVMVGSAGKRYRLGWDGRSCGSVLLRFWVAWLGTYKG